MSKSSWHKLSGDTSKSFRRDTLTGKFTDVKKSAGSVLTQRERVTKALKSANTQTQTFKPKNAR